MKPTVGLSVRVHSESDPALDLAVGFITGTPDDQEQANSRVPEGYVEVQFRLVDPDDDRGISHAELFEWPDEIVEVFC